MATSLSNTQRVIFISVPHLRLVIPVGLHLTFYDSVVFLVSLNCIGIFLLFVFMSSERIGIFASKNPFLAHLVHYIYIYHYYPPPPPMPPPVLMNFVVFPPACGYSVADF